MKSQQSAEAAEQDPVLGAANPLLPFFINDTYRTGWILSVFITVLTGVPLMLVVVWARYSEQDFSLSVLLKVLTLPKGREKCVQPLKHTSSGINSHPLKYAHAHKHTTLCSGCRHGVRWALKNRLKRPSPKWRFCFQGLPRSILQPVPSPAEDGGVVVSVEMTFFKGISRPFISIS